MYGFVRIRKIEVLIGMHVGGEVKLIFIHKVEIFLVILCPNYCIIVYAC